MDPSIIWSLVLTILWLISTLIGLGMSLWNRADAERDLNELDPSIQNGRRDLAKGWVRRETVRAIGNALGLGCVAFAFFGQGWLVQLLLVLMIWCFVANTILDFRQRRRLNKSLGIKH